MDVPDRDVLALPLRARLFRLLAELCRPATTQELSDLAGRHHNTVRVQLQRLAAAGLLERRVVAQPRGRPRHMWVVAPAAQPGGRPPEAYGQLSRWLARAIAGAGDLAAIEATGREIGRELAAQGNGRPPAESMLDALAALGFVPRADAAPGGVRFILRNCPYRDAVQQNPPAICNLHRGITRGLLDRLAPDAELTGFVARDPRTAGCEIEIRT
jgi:predicted ArsR family transcriptional regulator